MRQFYFTMAIFLATFGCKSAHADINLAPCDSEITTEYQNFDQSITIARDEWRMAVVNKIKSARLTEEKRQQFEVAYAKEISNVIVVILREMETVAKTRVVAILPAYEKSMCEKIPALRQNNERIATAYKKILLGFLETLDKELADASK